MTNTLKINHINHTIVMDRTFARNATDTRSEEYAHLQQVRRDYPGYQVVQRRIRTNSNKKTYKGLTYEYTITSKRWMLKPISMASLPLTPTS